MEELNQIPPVQLKFEFSLAPRDIVNLDKLPNFSIINYYHRAYDSGSSTYVSWIANGPDLDPDLGATTPPSVGPLIGAHIESINRT